LVLFTGLLTGMAFALQLSVQLQLFGMTFNVNALITNVNLLVQDF
jgi:ABC-type transporter Mla maintaining outer membrane lipid asymmetry permease subunit MlaE